MWVNLDFVLFKLVCVELMVFFDVVVVKGDLL